MAAFEYTAIDKKGKQTKGVMEGDAARQVRAALREKGMIPLSVEPTQQKGGGTKGKEKSGGSVGRLRLSSSELALITRQLATLSAGGLPLEECLKAVGDQCEKPKIKTMMLSVRARVVEGHSLADGLTDYPTVFDRLYRSMVAAGEKAGHLDEVLERLADHTENQQRMKQKITSAMVYPIILLVVSISIVSALLAFVVPQIVSQFESSGAELPTLTIIMLTLSDFIRAYGVYTLVALIAAYWFIKVLLKNENRLRKWHAMQLRIPMIGRLILVLSSARFARTLSILTASGVPLLEGLKISGDVLNNLVLREAMKEVAISVREGSSLFRAMERTGYFPPIMIHMIASGERSGELEQMLTRTATNQEGEFESFVTVMLNLMEPLMILVMGGMVFTIVLAVLLPIFSINKLI